VGGEGSQHRRPTPSAPEVEAVSASDPPHARLPDTSLSPLDRIRSFDLNRLNWLGWLLLFGTFVLAVVGSILLASFLGEARPDQAWLSKALMVAMLLLATGFFFSARWFLGKFGITIYRS
jgi:hypothetical protein